MYELEIVRQISAAHRLTGYPGNCRNLHGHNYEITVFVTAEKLDAIGIALDFKVFKGEVEKVLNRFDHAYLNELEEFAECNPTSENLARVIYGLLSAALNRDGVKVSRVRVGESPGSYASYWE